MFSVFILFMNFGYVYTGNCFQDYFIMKIKKVKNNSFIKYRSQWKYFLKLHNSILNYLDRTKIVSSVLLEHNRSPLCDISCSIVVVSLQLKQFHTILLKSIELNDNNKY